MVAEMTKRAEIRRLAGYLGFAKRQQAQIEGKQASPTWPSWVLTPDTKSLFSPAYTDMFNTLVEITLKR